MFDVREQLDELRCRDTDWLRARREEALRAQRRWHVLREGALPAGVVKERLAAL